MKKILPLLLAAFVAHGQTRAFQDAFDDYPEGIPPSRNWFCSGEWLTRDGALQAGGVRRSIAAPADVPYGGDITFEAAVTPLGATGRDWKTMGLAVYWDAQNYWLFCLTEFPGGDDSKHIIELNSMVDGVWQTATQEDTKLAEWPPVKNSGPWRTGKTYTMRLAFSDEGIRAFIDDDAGNRVYENGYRFAANSKTVRAGVPVLWNQAYNTRFDNVSLRVAKTVAPPAEPVNQRRLIPAPHLALEKAQYHFKDDFNKTRNEAAVTAPWHVSTRFWETKNQALRSADTGRVHASPDNAPVATTVRIDTDITISQSIGGSWKQAGVAITKAPDQYWLLCLTEEPGNHAGAKHMFELNEMLPNRRWQAQNQEATKLEVVEARSFAAWEKHTTYKMRLEMTPEWIDGLVFSPHGEIVYHARYLFKDGTEAVRSGAPVLWNQGFDCSYDNVEFAANGVTGEKPHTLHVAKPSYEPYKPRPYTAEPMGEKLAATPPGFFRVTERDGVAWFVDPNGFAYFSVGVEQVKYSGHFSPALGYSPYNRNILAKYGNIAKWADATSARLREWGFNTASVMPYAVAPGGGEAFLDGISVTLIANIGKNFVAYSDLSPVTINGFPNVFHPRWQEMCDAEAMEFCARFRDNPWILGYYIDNELDWHGSSCAAFFIHTSAGGALEYGLIYDILRKPADHSARLAFLDFLRKRHGTVAKLNTAWGTTLASFEALKADDVFTLGQPLSGSLPDMREFLRVIADRYYAATSSAIRKADPNHLILGTRFAGWSQDPVWEMCGKHCDVVSVNHYPFVELEDGTVNDARDMLNHVVTLCNKPILLSEWSFVSLDSGLTCKHGAGERFDTEEQRARAFQIYQSLIMETPFCVGSDYFMWVDQPVGGMQSASNPEDCSYGLVKEDDTPYPILIPAATEINRLAVPLHSQTVPALRFQPTPSGLRLIVQDRFKTPRAATLELWTNGTRTEHPLTLGNAKDITLPVGGNAPTYATARIKINGLPSTDRQSAFIDAFWAPPNKTRTLAVANSGSAAIDNYLAEIPLPDAKPLRATLPGGTVPQQQIETIDGQTTLLVLLEKLPPRAAALLTLAPDPSAKILTPQPATLPLAIDNGPLKLTKQDNSAKLLDSVSLGTLQLGELGALLWQKTPQNQFVQPASLLSLTAIQGPVRTTLCYDVALLAGASPDLIPEVGLDGSRPTPSSSPVGAFRATYRVRVPRGVPFYYSQCRSVQNLANFTWTLDRYYHYMRSFIGGDKAGDIPENGRQVTEYYNPALAWFDKGENAGYGVVRPRGFFGSHFWLDDAGGQHPDLCRLLRTPLAPGESWENPAEHQVPIFGVRGAFDQNPWDPISRDIAARNAVRLIESTATP